MISLPTMHFWIKKIRVIMWAG